MRQRVTISFVEKLNETVELETCKGFFESLMGHHLPMWCDVDGEINVSVEPVAASSDEATPLQSQVAEFLKRHGDEYFKDLDFRNSATAALNSFMSSRSAGKTAAAMEFCSNEYIDNLRKHYGCDDGGAQ